MIENVVLLYTPTHEWVRIKKGKTIVVGISEYAQSQISDATSIELPEPDEQIFEAGEELGAIESLKLSWPFHAPVKGKITKVNTNLLSNPELVNSDPYADGWLFEMLIDNISRLNELMNQDEYESNFPEEEEE